MIHSAIAILPLYPESRHSSQPEALKQLEELSKSSFKSVSLSGVSGNLQFSHNLLTSLCAIIVLRLEASKYDSIPISLNRAIAATALFVCTVDKTRCPVKLD